MLKIFVFISFPFLLFSQDTLLPLVILDDVIISEERNGFSVEDFINYVKKDTTFYKGFKHMRYFQHNFKGELNIYNKQNKKIGSLIKHGTHFSDNLNAYIIYDTLYSSGKIFKRNGEYKYYTPKAFDEVFFPSDTIPVSLNINKKEINKGSDSQNMRDAKTIGFSIGTDNIEQNKGGIKKKLAIFDIDMQQYYNYLISDTLYNGYPCYIFSVTVKEDLSKKKKEKALVRKVISFFDKENLNVLFREYKFIYKNWLLDLDISVIVNMDYVNDKHVPMEINYNGFWNVIFFKSEKVDFSLSLSDYSID